jgi:membrane-bound lytic murein transglycosylase B
MIRILCVFIAILLVSQEPLAASGNNNLNDAFRVWLKDFRKEAISIGISQKTLDRALTGLKLNPRIIKLDRKQPEFTQTIWGYLDKRVTQRRIDRAKKLLNQHRGLLEKVRIKFGVQPRFLVSFWGLETNFGDYTGKLSVVRSLATLAFDPRRKGYFRKELITVLRIIDQGDMKADVQGSWAGAMGQSQFMPSTFQRYAVDMDGDGRRNLWSSLPDVFGSSANFLSSVGWQKDRTWGREVMLPKGFNVELSGLGFKKHVSDWQRMGVRRANGGDLPPVDIEASLILPAGHLGPAFLVYTNFRKIMIWNRSISYALAVGYLSDRIAGRGKFKAKRSPDLAPLSRKQVLEIQGSLNAKGFSVGQPDGVIGPVTRSAIKSFQKSASLPPDGFASHALLKALRR